jgi:ABC-2 type transport system permease protein
LLFYSFNVFVLGFSLVPFLLNLIVTGWCIGVLTTGLIMRYGQEVEVLAWGLVFLFQPISCVFYPMNVLPPWLQTIAWANPAAHVFEGMRAVITAGTFPGAELAWASGLNALYLSALILWFHMMFSVCKEKGLLVRVGE